MPTTTVPQRPAHLRAGWTRAIDTSLGMTVGVPPGWTSTTTGSARLIRSPDHLVAVSISADRTEDALTVALADFATRALAALPGASTALEPSPARPFAGTPLQAVATHATGALGGGNLDQRVTLVVLRHGGYVTFTAVIAANARRAPAVERREAIRVVRTLRDFPVSGAPGPSYGIEPRNR